MNTWIILSLLKSLFLFEGGKNNCIVLAHELASSNQEAEKKERKILTLVFGSRIFTPYIEICNSIFGVFCPSDFFICLANWKLKTKTFEPYQSTANDFAAVFFVLPLITALF